MKWLKVCLLTLLALALLPLMASFAEDDAAFLKLNLIYEYDKARAVFPLVNAFRAEEGVWYWNGNNSAKVYPTGLRPLSYDYGLEKTAMRRAAECAIRYAHTRPNGESWSTVYPSGGGYRAENIAIGYGSASRVFAAWREENKNYDGQGHRRNMLNTAITAIGVGCVCAGGRYYWAQAFSSAATGETEVIFTPPAMIEAKLSVLSELGMTDIVPIYSNIQMEEGDSMALPGIQYTQCNSVRNISVELTNPAWTVEKTGILSFSGSRMTGISGGKTRLYWTGNGTSVQTTVTVLCRIHDWNIVTIEATSTTHGSKTSTCTRCGRKKEVETLHWLLPMEETVECVGVPPTYETKGQKPFLDSYCSICYQLFGEEIPALKDLSVLTLPSELVEIGAEAFQGADCQAAIIPGKCMRIDEYAFRNCSSLIFVSIPAGAVVDTRAFDGSDQVWIYRRETEP